MPSRPAPASRAGLGLGLLLLAACGSHAGAPDSIVWRTDLERARAEAQALGRPIWLQFTAPWCGYCRMMERESFARPDVVALARARFVTVQASPEVDEDLARTYNITGIPATLLLKPTGEVIARQDGYTDPASFRALLDRVPVPNRPTEAIALAGYCPVRLVWSGRLEAGQPSLAVRHEGRDYRFADASARAAFLKEPSAFVPVDGGRCVVSRVDQGRSIPGIPAFGVLYRRRLYLCADATARARFAADPERYARSPLAATATATATASLTR